MEKERAKEILSFTEKMGKAVICVIFFMLITPFDLFSARLTQFPKQPENQAESVKNIIDSLPAQSLRVGKTFDFQAVPIDSIMEMVAKSAEMSADDSIAAQLREQASIEPPEWEERPVAFNPDPNKAVWYSALFPGLGQVYNRRYWKLPIVAGAYLGLGYATNWNNNMLRDYTRAYNDIMDNDPSTKSYMDFFPPTAKEEDLDKTWLTNTLKSRKDFYRRNRDLCIIGMVGVYLLAMVDAYVDASLSHFDISPDLSMDVAPVVIQDGRNKLPSVGVHWAINF